MEQERQALQRRAQDQRRAAVHREMQQLEWPGCSHSHVDHGGFDWGEKRGGKLENHPEVKDIKDINIIFNGYIVYMTQK